MKRFLSLKFLIGLAVGAGLLTLLSNALNEDESDTNYGDPDGEVSDGEVSGGEVSSFVD